MFLSQYLCPLSVALLRNYWSSATAQLFYPLPGNDQGKDLLLSGHQIGSDWQQRENNGLCNWTTDTLCDFSKKKKVNTVLQGLEEEITRTGGGGRLGGEDVALDPHLDQRSQVGDKKYNAFFDISKNKLDKSWGSFNPYSLVVGEYVEVQGASQS